jgi:hypothetical protein
MVVMKLAEKLNARYEVLSEVDYLSREKFQLL